MISVEHLYNQTRRDFVDAAQAVHDDYRAAAEDGWQWHSDLLAIALGTLPELMTAGRAVARIYQLEGAQIKALVLYALERETEERWSQIPWPLWARVTGLSEALRRGLLFVAPWLVEVVYRRAGPDITGKA